MTDCPRGRARLARPVAVIALGLAVSACGSGLPSPAASSAPLTAQSPSPSPSPSPAPAAEASPSPSPLAGKVIGIDPGHNGGNFADPGAISKQGLERPGMGVLRHHGHGHRRRLHGGAVQLQRRPLPARRPAPRRRARGDDAHHQQRRRAVRRPAGPDHQRRGTRTSRSTSTRTAGRASGRGFTVLEPVADGPNDSGDRVVAAVRPRRPPGVPGRHGDAGEHLRPAWTASCRATTWPGSISPPSPRC